MCDIKNGPGKFEGEPCYASTIYEAILDGATDQIDFVAECCCASNEDCDHVGNSVEVFRVDDAFRAAHGIGDDIVAIAAEESDSGFLYTSELTAEGLAQLEAEAQS